jgi:hypothetical protein
MKAIVCHSVDARLEFDHQPMRDGDTLVVG